MDNQSLASRIIAFLAFYFLSITSILFLGYGSGVSLPTTDTNLAGYYKNTVTVNTNTTSTTTLDDQQMATPS